ncbi:MAG: carotenoid biosynthesis protein [Anaerolineae bacterium]|nr:carotenoid biosynthesis protein [Anaerolineae bacterium]
MLHAAVPVPQNRWSWILCLSLWLLALTATPIAIWVEGEHTFPFFATLGVLAHTAATLTALSWNWSASQLFKLIGTLGSLTWFAEFIGSSTGFPFGRYHYTNLLQPQLADVPLIIPFAWLMMLPAASAVSTALLRHTRWQQSPLIFAAVSGLAFTAWDLYLDPQMVDKGLWVWETSGGYFGIPWVNFLGWWGVSTLITLVIRPMELPLFPLLTIYGLTWIFQAVGLGLFWGQPAPAFCGFLVMGIFFMGAAWKQWSGR